jgi:protein-L-isoaspartate O-methyltransferase
MFGSSTERMMVSVILNLVILLVLLVVLYLLLRPIIHGAIYLPTTPVNVEKMVALADIRPGQSVVDLGSGDGRLLIACARRGSRAEGYEINPFLVIRSRRAIRKAGLQNLAVVHWKSFWHADFARFDVVMLYGITYIMEGLQKKFIRELNPGAKIVSNVFQFPGWRPIAEDGNVFLYDIKKS